MRLRDRVALITGASRGIGRAIALGYAREGARLALASRTSSELEETAREAQELGAETCVIPTDVTDRAQVDEMVRRTVDRFSTLDILVNNAGLAGPVGPLQDNDVDYWCQTIQVNVIGVFLCCRAALPVMLSQDRGKIINLYGGRGRNLTSYGASKVAVADITETLATELAGTNVRVNALSPGSINTRMWEETRDAAEAIGDTELFELGQRVTSGGGASMARVTELAVILGGDESGDLNGRVLSAVAEDLSTLPQRIPGIMASDAGTLKLLSSR